MTEEKAFRPKLPPWIRVKVSCGEGRKEVDSLLKALHLNTVCESARCPNLNECWHKKTATFMILGDSCTRDCKFCAVPHSKNPPPPDPEEPRKVALAVEKLNLKYVVITSVTRDDLPDGGASHFAAVIRELRKKDPAVGIEALTPDFNCDRNALQTVLQEKLTVFNHNVETVERLSEKIRSKATYRKSLKTLALATEITNGETPVKSGFMLGLGETEEEIKKTICELRETGVDILTIGQYLPPTKKHWKLERYATPEEFKEWEKFAYDQGFSFVASAPLVRSSYNAAELLEKDPKARN
jgi:lipoic acid synthetase